MKYLNCIIQTIDLGRFSLSNNQRTLHPSHFFFNLQNLTPTSTELNDKTYLVCNAISKRSNKWVKEQLLIETKT